jgi:hypothetical protein
MESSYYSPPFPQSSDVGFHKFSHVRTACQQEKLLQERLLQFTITIATQTEERGAVDRTVASG